MYIDHYQFLILTVCSVCTTSYQHMIGTYLFHLATTIPWWALTTTTSRRPTTSTFRPQPMWTQTPAPTWMPSPAPTFVPLPSNPKDKEDEGDSTDVNNGAGRVVTAPPPRTLFPEQWLWTDEIAGSEPLVDTSELITVLLISFYIKVACSDESLIMQCGR